jgi:energy-coupling factor transporter ATP-binding protein EcfA2
MSRKTLEIEVHNIGPHGTTRLQFSPGVNVLTGRNGAGKSTFIGASVAALGGDEKVTVRDGAVAGSVAVDGVVTLKVGRAVSPKGHPTVELGAYSPVSDVIDGAGLADPTKADARRVKALLALVPIEVTPAVRSMLVGGNEKMASELPPPEVGTNVLAVGEWYRRRANELALQEERAAERAAGSALGAAADLQEVHCELEPAEAMVRENEASLALARAEAGAAARKEAEARRERMQALVARGEPDVQSARDAAASAAFAVTQARDNVTRLREELARAHAEFEERARDDARARLSLAGAESAHSTWKAAQEEASKPVTGPTEEDVEAAKAARARAVAKVAEAKACAAYRDGNAKAAAWSQERQKREEEAKVLRLVAANVSTALGEVLAKHGLAGIAYEDGRLFAVDMHGGAVRKRLFADRLSFGERTRLAMALALPAFAGRFIPFDPSFWAALQPSHKTEMAAIARELGVYLVTEEPTDDDVITVRSMP